MELKKVKNEKSRPSFTAVIEANRFHNSPTACLCKACMFIQWHCEQLQTTSKWWAQFTNSK